MSIEGCARKNPLTPPADEHRNESQRKQRSRIDLEIASRTRLPSQISVSTVAGIVIVSVGKENASEDIGFIPLRNM